MNYMMKLKMILLLTAIVILACSGCQNKEKTLEKRVEISGAGATFPLPFYNMAFKSFMDTTNNIVSYGGIGSGGGLRSLKNEILDFAGSDAYLSDEEMEKMKSVIHIPTCMGAVVVAYNLPGSPEINLTGKIIADIYSGKITNWNDISIQAVNQNVTLPNMKITPVYRSDGSGTTFIFTDYLSKVSSDWANEYGRGKSVNFFTGLAAKGNPGVAGIISQTPGAIGYVGSEYAFAQQITFASLQNTQGEFVKPSTTSISAAAQIDLPDDTRCMITNSDAQGAYPISCFTWIIVYKEQNYNKKTEQDKKVLVDLLRFMLSDEIQNMTEKVHYAPLSQQVREKSLKAIDAIEYNANL